MQLKSQEGITTLIPQKIGFKPKLVRKHRKEHFILIKGKKNPPIDIVILNICAPNFIKETLLNLKPYMDPNTVVVLNPTLINRQIIQTTKK